MQQSAYATALGLVGLLIWSMALPNAAGPGIAFWILAAVCGCGLMVLWWKSPQYYALLASAILLGLPMGGEWVGVGANVAAGLMGAAALRWWWTALRGHTGWAPRYQWAILFTLVWVAWGIVSAAGSADVARSLPVALRTAAIVLGGLACGQWLGGEPATVRRWLLVAGAGLACLVGWTWLGWGAAFKAAPLPYWQDANFLSAGLALPIPLLIWAAATGGPRWERWAAGGLAAVLLVGVLRFDSRGAWLSLAVAAAFIPVLRGQSPRRRLAWLGILLGAALVYGLVMPRIADIRRDSHAPLDRLQSITDTGDFSNRERLLRWECAWRMALEKPVLGHGPARFSPLFKNFLQDKQEVDQIAWWFGWRFGAHSDALNALAETGFPGLALWLAMLVAWSWPTLRGRWAALRNEPLLLALLIALLTWIVHGCFNDLLTSPCIAAWVFVCWGMVERRSVAPVIRVVTDP